jgi:adenylate kinase family enzyme
MKNVIFIAGAPGSGKTTIARLLKEKLQSPHVDLGWLRQFHLDREWKRASESEERMSFENLVSILKNYIKNGYQNVIVTDLTESKVHEISGVFQNDSYIIISLTVGSDEELEKRVLGERDSGFKNVEAALRWNQEVKERPSLPNEHKLDNSHDDPKRTVEEILKLIV